jgi:hypothetical protein
LCVGLVVRTHHTTFMGGDDSHLFRADENSQSGTSSPESGTSLQSVLLHRITHATRAAIGKEDSGGISHCKHSLSGRSSSLLVLCVEVSWCAHTNCLKRRFKLRRSHHETHTQMKPGRRLVRTHIPFRNHERQHVTSQGRRNIWICVLTRAEARVGITCLTFQVNLELFMQVTPHHPDVLVGMTFSDRGTSQEC